MNTFEPHGLVTFEDILQGALGQEEAERAEDYMNNSEAYRRSALVQNKQDERENMIDYESMYDMRVTFRLVKNQVVEESREQQTTEPVSNDTKGDAEVKQEQQSKETPKGNQKKEIKSSLESERKSPGDVCSIPQQPEKKQSVQKKKSAPVYYHRVPPGWSIPNPKKLDTGATVRIFQSPDGKTFHSLESAYEYWTKQLNQVHPIDRQDVVKENVTIPQLVGVIKTLGVVGMEGGYIRSWDVKNALKRIIKVQRE
eukprot:TRINITY_DN7784_c0_g1_i1.p2 TRINITY_DN7784_c0_g1~~TRINITY_DN7784_c0_g1_i1.p2  ORF type:complete len:255 (-),score=34.98 TRINITY_DN7784_c0_g1_i1:920-1684(-)